MMESIVPQFVRADAAKCLAVVMLALVLAGTPCGCAAVTNPAAKEGIPVRLVPDELLVPPRAHEVTLPLTLLRQPQPDAYRLAPGDTLGVYVEGFLGERNQPLPVYVGDRTVRGDERRLPPATGYPVLVQENGTILLPFVEPLNVQGMSLAQAQEAVHKLYVDRKLLNPRLDRVIVTLLQPRLYKVLVFRSESTNPQPTTGVDVTKRGSGFMVDLPAYENDVLHALSRTGGLPGLDSFDEVIIYRDCFRDAAEAHLFLGQLKQRPNHGAILAGAGKGETVCIPLRVPRHAVPPIHPRDVILQSGDVVFVKGRNDQVFYTGGLLPPGVHILPRDLDLDVLTAVAYVHGPLINGAFGGNNLSGALIAPGVGSPSPRLVTVVRRTPNGGQLNIRVDLRKAIQDPRERILLQAGDLLILQETPEDALARYVAQSFFNFNLVWEVIHGKFVTGVIDIFAPDRQTGRVGTGAFLPQQQQ